MADPLLPQAALPPAMPAGDDPQRAAMIRKLTLALMMQGGGAPQQPPQEALGGLAQGFQQGNRFKMQGDLNNALGIESPWQRMIKQFAGGGGGTPPMAGGGMIGPI